MLTGQERETALALLEKSRQTLVDAVAGVSDEQSRWKPAPERWSILEYVEHLAISDDGLVALIRRSLTKPSQPETAEERAAREAAMRGVHAPRGANQAPEMLLPTGRYAGLAEALAAFHAARDRSVEFARTTQEDLRSHFTPHPVYGRMDGFQWLCGNARHAELHAGHIRELREMLAAQPA